MSILNYIPYLPDINYVVVSTEFQITCYIGYTEFGGIIKYYDISNPLHKHIVVKDHYTLVLI